MTLCVWRHPRPQAVAGRCIGHTDVLVDARKAKRLAHRIRQHVRRQSRLLCRSSVQPVVVTSPLQRAACVGRWLRAWGWRHRIDPRLSELDFGGWDGRLWSDVPAADINRWCAEFEHHAVGGGESVAQLLDRCRAFLRASHAGDTPEALLCIVGHAGWISAAAWLSAGHAQTPTASDWPPAVGYGALRRLSA